MRVFGPLQLVLSFLLLLMIQVLILNNIRFGGYINPYVYVLFVLILPIDIRGWVLLTASFALGLTVDVFMDSLGMHAAASVLMAFCRPGVIRLISVKSDFEPGTVPGIANQGLRWIATYSVLLILVHHSSLFLLEVFRLSDFLQTFQRIILSSFFTFLFVIGGFMFMGKPRRHR